MWVLGEACIYSRGNGQTLNRKFHFLHSSGRPEIIKNIHRGCSDSSFREKCCRLLSLSVVLSCTGYLQRADNSLGVYLLWFTGCDVESDRPCPALPQLLQSWVNSASRSALQHSVHHQLWNPCCCSCPLVQRVSPVMWGEPSVPASSWPALFFHPKLVNNGQTELNLLQSSQQAK